MEINWKWNLFLGLILGFTYWIFGFNFIGMTKMPGTPIAHLYIPFVFIFAAIIHGSLLIIMYFLRSKILEDEWLKNTAIIGAIICAIQFIMDIIVMPWITWPIPVIFYFFGGSTVMIFYPLIVPGTITCGWGIRKLKSEK
ncbi:MAG: hypothetical protein ACXQS8_06025 [Candidatus Helarchaeales archaeon]